MKICLSCEGVIAVEQSACEHCACPLLDRDRVHYPRRAGERDAGNPLLGSVVDGKYRLTAVLGRGGMGVVFRAVHQVSLVPVALKLLHPRFGRIAAYRRSLILEARRASRVVHEGVARVIDVGETEDGSVYLAMELAAGLTLDALVPRGRPLPAAAAVEILDQICRALEAIHAAGLVHRDLSARNVMVAVDRGVPRVKILDFGIAKAEGLEADAGGQLPTRANPAFSSPEHIRGLEVDERSDVYSLGVIAYLMLAGHLPIEEAGPAEAARATVEGRLKPLRPGRGVPRRLARLCARCLERDPDRRPGSAAEILRELDALRGKGSGLLRAVAGAAAASAALFAFLTYSMSAEPFLALVPGGHLGKLVAPGSTAEVATVHLHPDRLGTLDFTAGGFDPQSLRVQISRGGVRLSSYRLEPEVGRDGRLVLSTAQPGWRAALSGIEVSSREGPADLQFLVPWRPPFGGVRVRLDSEAPKVSLSTGSSAGILTSETPIDVEVEDRVGTKRVALRAREPEGSYLAGEIGLPAVSRQRIRGADLLDLMPGVSARGPVDLVLFAWDLAGNEARTSIRFDGADLAAPRIRDVRGAKGSALVSYLGREADLDLWWSDVEEGIRIRVTNEQGAEREISWQPAGHELRSRASLRLPPGAIEGFSSGDFAFVVEDAAGNRSRSVFPLRFKERDLHEEVALEDEGLGHAVMADGDIACDGSPFRLLVRCSDAYSLGAAELRHATGLGAALAVGRLEPDGWSLPVPELEPGIHRLALRFEPGMEIPLAEAIERTRRILCLPAPVTVRVDGGDARFLRELIERDVLRSAEGGLILGSSVRFPSELLRHVRGRAWFGSPSAPPIAVPPTGGGDSGLLPPTPPVVGENIVAVDLRDALGRPVDVRVGEKPAARIRVAGGTAAVLARFWYDPEGPQLLGEAIAAEYEQQVAVKLRSRTPFAASDARAIALGFGNQIEVPATQVSPDPGGGASILFHLPAETWTRSAVLEEPVGDARTVADLSRSDYSRNLKAHLDAYVATPAGRSGIRLPFRTVRTMLRTVSLGELETPIALPPAVGAMRLVPVLAPVPPVWRDPVPADAKDRALFRARPFGDITGIEDILMLDREVTVAQYLGVLDAYLALPAGRRGAPWHGTDPLGARRIERSAMMPALGPAADRRPDGPVTGVDFYQAWCWCGMLSILIGDDPRLLRLPLGCELELAAFGGKDPAGMRNAAAARGRPIRLSEFQRFAGWWEREGHAPSAADCEAAGDASLTGFGAPILGLDFGVREWVADLPRGGDPKTAALLQEWTGDRGLHLRRILQMAGGMGEMARIPAMHEFGVVHGLSFGERGGLIDPETFARLSASFLGAVPPWVAGVVRCEQIRRDGNGLLPGEKDPLLSRIGFRVVGGPAMADLIRRRAQ
ncbi:MAG: hypothetical protein Fur0037_16730 [Planctomycetota bacterium]